MINFVEIKSEIFNVFTYTCIVFLVICQYVCMFFLKLRKSFSF